MCVHNTGDGRFGILFRFSLVLDYVGVGVSFFWMTGMEFTITETEGKEEARTTGSLVGLENWTIHYHDPSKCGVTDYMLYSFERQADGYLRCYAEAVLRMNSQLSGWGSTIPVRKRYYDAQADERWHRRRRRARPEYKDRIFDEKRRHREEVFQLWKQAPGRHWMTT